MAFRKLLAVAACLSVSLGAPQTLVHSPLAGAAVVRAAGVPTFLSHGASPLVRTVAHPSALHTVAHNVAAPTVVRTVAQPAVVRTVAHPAETVAYSAPAVHEVTHIAEQEEVEVVDNPQYNFAYSVSDAVSGDFKNREEVRDGDAVTGSYSVADPDGRIRTVTYTADKYNGFQAEVTYDGQPGPVAIPFNAPASNAVAATTTVAAADNAVEVIEARNNVATVAAAPAVVRTAAAAPSVFRTVAAAPAAVHHAINPTVVRTVAAAPAAVHHAINPTVVRTVAAAPAAVHHAFAPSVVRTVAAPAAVHAVHNSFQPSVVRTVAAAPAVHALPAFNTLLHA